jgi:mRNA interferase MazF
MRRSEIWTLAGGLDYASKPRPVIILQDDRFDGTDSITICGLTTDKTDAPLFRLPVVPNERNGLRLPCQIMVDKITTVPKTKIGRRLGKLDDVDMMRLNRAAIVFLGLGSSHKATVEQ